MTFTVAGEAELDFVAPLPQPYKKTAVRIATVASVQNDALRDMVKTSGEFGRKKTSWESWANSANWQQAVFMPFLKRDKDLVV